MISLRLLHNISKVIESYPSLYLVPLSLAHSLNTVTYRYTQTVHSHTLASTMRIPFTSNAPALYTTTYNITLERITLAQHSKGAPRRCLRNNFVPISRTHTHTHPSRTRAKRALPVKCTYHSWYYVTSSPHLCSILSYHSVFLCDYFLNVTTFLPFK